MIALLMAGAIWVACEPVPHSRGYVFEWHAADGSLIGLSAPQPSCTYRVERLACRVYRVRAMAVGLDGTYSEPSNPVRGFPTIRDPSAPLERRLCRARPGRCSTRTSRWGRVFRFCWMRRG